MTHDPIPKRRTSMRARKPHRLHQRQGATLIDVAVGSMLLSVLLIPSVHLVSESQSSRQRLTNRNTMLFEAEQLLEKTRVALSDAPAFAAASSRPIDQLGTIVVSDGPDIRSRLRVQADTAVPNLVSINVDLWIDSNGDSRLSAGELSESLRTQWAAP